MAVADPKSPNTAVRVEKGDTLSAIAKANGLTLSEIRALNPALMSNPKYDNGNMIFSNTKINIAPPTTPATTTYNPLSGTFTTDSQNTARLAAEQAARDAAAKAAADAAAKAAADAEAKAKAEAEAKAKAEADARAAELERIKAELLAASEADDVAGSTEAILITIPSGKLQPSCRKAFTANPWLSRKW